MSFTNELKLRNVSKLTMASVVAVCLFFISSSLFAQYADWPEEDVFIANQEQYKHLEYFGFYASAMGNWNYTEELASFTNLTWVHINSTEDPAVAIGAIIQRVNEARDAGVQATLSIEPFLFTGDRGKLQPDVDIVDFLVELRAQLEFSGLLGTVAMIYPMDEPFRVLIDRRNPNFVDQYITGKAYEEIHADLVHLNALIKLAFPEKPLGVILSGFELHHKFFSIPENYDWVGFDCYRNLFKSCDDRSFVEHYSQLLKYMQPHQRLIAVPEAWAVNEAFGQADWPDILASRMKQHYEMALSEPRFVAFIPFIWSFDSEGETPGLGLNRFAELYDDGVSDRGTAFMELVMDIGLQIKQGEPDYPNMTYDETENSRYRPENAYQGEIMGINQGGLLSARVINTALPHKNLQVQVLVRDRWGRLIHKSRPERTFIRDPALSEQLRIDGPGVGLHGYRYQLPISVIYLGKWQHLDVELFVYADGSPRTIGSIFNLGYDAGPKLPRPPSQPLSSLLSVSEKHLTTGKKPLVVPVSEKQPGHAIEFEGSNQTCIKGAARCKEAHN